jgi:GNAT superfamily N-acetyltransferase
VIAIRAIAPEQTHPLRLSVLRRNSVGKEVVWDRDADPDTFHLGGYADGRLVCIATFQCEGCPQPDVAACAGDVYRLRGMATDPAYERRGIASALLAVGLDRLRRRGAALLWCHARVGAVNFYRKNGWDLYGEEFLVEDVGPHRWMAVRVADTPRPCAGEGKR